MIEKRDYIVTDLSVENKSPEELLSGVYDDEILKRMEAVIECEGPIKESLLFKRVINSFSLMKVGSRLLELLIKIEERLPFEATVENGEKVFHNGSEENFYRPTPDAAVRYSYQIPTIESANALITMLSSISGKPYKKELAPLFLSTMGWDKMGAKVRELFERGLEDERIKKSKNGRYSL